MSRTTESASPQPQPEDKALLLNYLRGQRRKVLASIEGLDDEGLQTARLPSGWAAVHLLHHLAVDDERFWLRAVIGGDQAAQNSLSENGWTVPDTLDPRGVVELYRAESALADAAVQGCDLDAAPAWWPDFLGERWLETNREVLLHHLVETATHLGHLDATRELIDGTQRLVIT